MATIDDLVDQVADLTTATTDLTTTASGQIDRLTAAAAQAAADAGAATGNPLGDYATGLVFNSHNDYTKDDVLYKLKDSVGTPYTTNATTYPTASDDPNLVAWSNVDVLKSIALALNVPREAILNGVAGQVITAGTKYIYDPVDQTTYGIPAGVGAGEVVDSIAAGILQTNVKPYTLIFTSGKIKYASDYGISGSGADESVLLNEMLRDGGMIDLQGLTISIAEPVSASGESIVFLNKGRVLYTGTEYQPYCASLSFKNVTDLAGIALDGAELCAKALQCISPNDARGNCVLTGTKTENAKITATTGALAACLYVAGDYDLVILDEPEANNADHSADLSKSARGINVLQGTGSGARRVVINNPSVSLVTPSNDGDGIVIQSDTSGAEVTINGLSSLNCAKRAIKTQIYKTTINSPIIRRDVVYPPTVGGQVEIDAQRGNIIVNNPTFEYLSADTYPGGGLMTFTPERGAGDTGAPPVLNGGLCIFLDQSNKTIGKIFECQSYVQDDVIKSAVCRDFSFDGKIDFYNPFLIRPLATSVFNKVLVDGLLIKNLYIEEVLSANPAVITSDRSGVGYAFTRGVKVIDCIVSDQQNDIAIVHEETVNVGVTIDISSRNHRILNTPSANIADRPYTQELPQNSALSKDIAMPLNSSLRFTFMYTCSNDPATSSTYIDGIVQMDNGSPGAVIAEFNANKTNALSGSLGVDAVVVGGPYGNEYKITFNKAAGSGTASGRATILLNGGGHVRGQ